MAPNFWLVKAEQDAATFAPNQDRNCVISYLCFSVAAGYILKQTETEVLKYRPHREKKKEQERDELWKNLEELKLNNDTLVQNNSHGLLAVQNNNNNNNNNNNSNNNDNNDNESKSVDAAAVTTDSNDPDATESSTCAKWQRMSAFYSVTVWRCVRDCQETIHRDRKTQITPQQYIKST